MIHTIVHCVGWAGLCAAGILAAYFICGFIFALLPGKDV